MPFAAQIRHLGDREVPGDARLVGYAALVGALGLERPVSSPSVTFDTHTRRSQAGEWRLVTARQAPEDTLNGHLGYALKHEPLDLAVLKAVFQATDRADIAAFVIEARTGHANRRAWFFHEWLTGERLPIPDLTMGNYVEALDGATYHTAEGATSRRHRVRDNLGGSPAFCPLVRRTDDTSATRLEGLRTSIQEMLNAAPERLLRRAASSLLFGETLTTYAIEQVRPPRDKLERWAKAILLAGRNELSEGEIARLQRIVLPDGTNEEIGWRTKQNYVGGYDRNYEAAPERVNPRPEDVRPLMDGWLDWVRGAKHLDPVAAAATASFAFVYVHPLTDGNGRMHRYLLHHILADRHFAPPGLVFPVSMPMLEKSDEYKAVLQAFDLHVMPHTNWRHDGRGGVEVMNDVSDFYRFPDMTREVGFVYDCVVRAVSHHFPAEIDQIARFDRAMEGMSRVADLADDRIRDFIMFARQNPSEPNRLPKNRAKKDFKDLPAETVAKLEAVVERLFGDQPLAPATAPPPAS